MTALALCYQDLGKKVSGSDIAEVFVTDAILAERRIAWTVGIGPQNLKRLPDLLVMTAAHGGLSNPEAVYAKEHNVPVITFADGQADLSKRKKTITVCGVGGKTTTCSMIATVLDYAGLHPSFTVGVGNIFPLGVPGRFDKKGEHFICEGDEFVISPGINNNPKFSLLDPKVVVVTNIEHDHPDIYPTIEDTKRVFLNFFKKIPKKGVLVACVDNKNVSQIVKKLEIPVVTYGFNKNADWQIKNLHFGDGKTHFSLISRTKKIKDLTLNIPGRFNVQNATAAFAVGNFLGLDAETLKAGLERYQGCMRRFQIMGQWRGSTFFDDYAHHPDEIKATLKAAREWFPERKITAVFQPHTYSRTKVLFKEFARAFSDTNVVALMDIYASAREKDDGTISSKMLWEETKKHHKNVFYTGGQRETLAWIKKNVRRGGVILTMGAGDIFHLYDKLFQK